MGERRALERIDLVYHSGKYWKYQKRMGTTLHTLQVGVAQRYSVGKSFKTADYTNKTNRAQKNE